VWRRDGRELFYRNGERMMAVTITPGAASPAAGLKRSGGGRTRLA